MDLHYGDTADWSDVRVYDEDENGADTEIANPIIKFRGGLNPQISEDG